MGGDGGGGCGEKSPSTGFSSVTFAKVGTRPKNFLAYGLSPFCHTGVKFEVRT